LGFRRGIFMDSSDFVTRLMSLSGKILLPVSYCIAAQDSEVIAVQIDLVIRNQNDEFLLAVEGRHQGVFALFQIRKCHLQRASKSFGEKEDLKGSRFCGNAPMRRQS